MVSVSIINQFVKKMMDGTFGWTAFMTYQDVCNLYSPQVPFVYWVPSASPTVSVAAVQGNKEEAEENRKGRRVYRRKQHSWKMPRGKKIRGCNMLPNLIRKMFRFVCSKKTKEVLRRAPLRLTED